MDVDGPVRSEMNQTEKGKYCMTSLIRGIRKKEKKTFIEKEIRLAIIKGGGSREAEMEEHSQNVETSSYTIKKSQGRSGQRDDYSQHLLLDIQ